MLSKKLIIPFVLLAFFFSQCNTQNKNTQPKEASANDPLLENRDTTIAPGLNFFMYANNGWFKTHPIPSSEKSNGIFLMVGDSIDNIVKGLCINYSQKTDLKEGSNEQKIGDMYASGMDTVTIDKLGISPLKEEFSAIDNIKTKDDLLDAIAHLKAIGVSSSFSFYIDRDDKNATKYIPIIMQGGLGLPDRDYYFNTDAGNTLIRKQYKEHLDEMFNLLKKDLIITTDKGTNVENNKIYDMEATLAKASRTLEASRDPEKNYNKKSIPDLMKLTPHFNWIRFFEKTGLSKVDYVNVGQPEFLQAFDKLFDSKSIADWKLYLQWNLVNSYAGNLSKPYEDQNFEFYGKQLTGQKEMKPRWKRIVQQTDGALGELIGQEFVANYLPKNTKEKLTEIANNIIDVYKEHIQKLDWMSDSTKQKALYKLSKVTLKMGYPNKWKDMSSVVINRNEYLKNIMRVNQWTFDDMIKRYGKPIDKERWDMTPQTYNAYYQPTANEIVIPGCNIIVPGYAKGEMPDDAILYGIIGGSTIGHEITHGFDDQGSQYDAEGNLKSWWTKEDNKKFTERSKSLAEMFNLYTVKADTQTLHIRGYATLGENIADLGGAVMGYEAFMKTKQAKEGKKISGYTPEQRYFLGFAYSWLVQRTDKSQAMQIMSDVHSPAMYRINGPLSNMPEFFAAFNIKEGDAMYRKEIIKIW
jgi:putative endopeptidase